MVVEVEEERRSSHRVFWVIWSLLVVLIAVALFAAISGSASGAAAVETGRAASASALTPADALARGQFAGVWDGLAGAVQGVLGAFAG